MSGLEIGITVGFGVIAFIDKIHSFYTRRKDKERIKNIEKNTRPQIIISNNGSLTPSSTPKEEENNDIDLDELIMGKYKQVPIYYNVENGQYTEYLPIQETPRPKNPY